jgi:hypothetical protein
MNKIEIRVSGWVQDLKGGTQGQRQHKVGVTVDGAIHQRELRFPTDTNTSKP